MARGIDIAIRARDEASRKFGQISNAAGRMSGVFRKIALAAGVGFSVAGIVKGVKEIINAASIAEETSSKFKAVFKEQAEAAEGFIDNLSEAVNRSKIELMGYMATLQDTFVPLGYARESAREMSQAMTQLAIDLASFNNKADANVIRDLQSAIVGNHETVRKYGVIITQASLNQQLMNMGIAEGVKEASEQQKALARLQIIMEGTTDAQGDAIRTAGSFANVWKGLKGDLFDGAAKIGGFVLPTISKAMSGIRKSFVAAEVVAENWKLVMELAGKSAALSIIDFAMDTKHWFTVVIPDLLLWFGRNWRQVFTDIWNATKAIFTNMWENIKNFFVAVWGWLKGEEFDYVWTGLLEGFESTLEEMPKIAERQMTGIEKTLSERISEIKKELAEKIQEKFELKIEAMGEIKTPELSLDNESKKLLKESRPKRLEAVESMYLTFGPGERFNQTEKNTAKTAKNTEMIVKQHRITQNLLKKMILGLQGLGGGTMQLEVANLK